jgi:hypothetical protein
MELAPNVKEIPLTTLKLDFAAAPLDTDKPQQVSVLSDVESMKFLTTESAAASLDTTQLVEFVVNVLGMRFMIKDLESAESLVILDVFSISANKPVSAYLNISS